MTGGESASTLRTEAAIEKIVAGRAPITVREGCYAFFTRGPIPSMARKDSGHILRITTEVRETAALDWQLIVDGSWKIDRPSPWRVPSAIIRAAAPSYRRARGV